MTTRRLLLPLAFATAVLPALFCGPQADGKGKPQPAPPATGEIHFWTLDELQDTRLAVMNADGTGKTLLPAAVPLNSQPTWGVYNGARWHVGFTETPGEFHPDGQPCGVLEAVREDGAARVTLVDDPAMYYNDGARWSKDDRWISFGGYRWDDSVSPPEPVASALYVVPIDFDTLVPLPLGTPVPVVDGGLEYSSPRYFPTIGAHDWSPQGD